jgi:putative acetyltransferase
MVSDPCPRFLPPGRYHRSMPTLRLASPKDQTQAARLYAPSVEGSHVSFETEAPSAEEMGRRLERTLRFAPWLACADGDELLGYAYLSPHRERAAYRFSVDCAVYVSGRARRGGVGRALYTSLFALARLQGFCAVHAGIALPNQASVGLHEAMGFTKVALYPKVGFKDGAWRDVGWWQLELRERSGPPEEPLSMEALLRHPRFTSALAAGAGRGFALEQPAAAEGLSPKISPNRQGPAGLEIVPDDLSGEPVRRLIARHLAGMHESSPPESVHAFDLERLRQPDLLFFSAWLGGELAGCGALKLLGEAPGGGREGELKSMRVHDRFLGQGVGRALLLRLLAEAKARGLERLWLETGSTPSFTPALRLYESAGFRRCGPFGDFQEDPFSRFLTREL